MLVNKIFSCSFLLSISLLFCELTNQSVMAQAQTRPVTYADQGSGWTETARTIYYVQDQGSRIMPLAWMRALLQPNGEGFLADGLSRYGYIKIQRDDAPDVPLGFSVAFDEAGRPSIGMTCSACHTRQIEVPGETIRIDGGPSIVDFEAFLIDLSAAVGSVLASDAAFEDFAARIPVAERDRTDLRGEVEIWHRRFNALVEISLPQPGLWGPSRLDAISMIFNRLTGLDIGEKPADIIESNMKPADAPTRYPFIWNAARQDKTQWLGFAKNGNDLLGLARNIGEVYGVFADFHPKKRRFLSNTRLLRRVLPDRDYLKHNSTNFEGLKQLEDLVWLMGPPRWNWPIDQMLADRGKQIFGRAAAEGGCIECHGKRKGANRISIHGRPDTWATPVYDVGTDSHQCSILERTVQTGIMKGASLPILSKELNETAPAFEVLSMTVIGAIIQNGVRSRLTQMIDPRNWDAGDLGPSLSTLENLMPELADIKSLYQRAKEQVETPVDSSAPTWEPSGCKYEARVLDGIWSAAPYLHNGSVASLRELLLPASIRKKNFQIGPLYDLNAVGMAENQPKFEFKLETTDCSDVASGNSRCGHEYGTGLPEADREALLEYLKTL